MAERSVSAREGANVLMIRTEPNNVNGRYRTVVLYVYE